MKVAIIGLPQSGKTTLFKALTGHGPERQKGALNIGVVQVPDERLEVLSRMYEPKRTVYATIEVMEANAPLGSKERRGLDPSFLNLVRPAEAFLLVVRAFDVPLQGNPREDLMSVLSDLILADLMAVENRLERLQSDRKKGKVIDQEEVLHLQRVKERLERGELLVGDPVKAIPAMRSFGFLTAKPIIVVANISEGDLKKEPETVIKDLGLHLSGLETYCCCAKVEEEIGDLPEEEREVFRAEMGVREPVTRAIVAALYRSLGLISFLTIGEDEIRAWPIVRGTTAVRAAGVVHSDMERGFIRAEVIRYEDLVALGSEAMARKAGKYRLEGRDYVVQDGDIIHFRFNV